MDTVLKINVLKKRKDSVYSDFIILQEFRAHRILLAACSPVFEAMCFGPLAEKGAIQIPDLEPKAFQALLQ